jgi:hypothetical protein
MAVEILANGIRNEKQIRGFEINLTGSNPTIKISQLADCKEKIENINWTKDLTFLLFQLLIISFVFCNCFSIFLC